MSNRHLSAHLVGEQKVFGRPILAPFGNADRKYPLGQTVGIISLLIFHPLVLTSIGFLIHSGKN
jgi:DMSO/TMAO reductase YedYZ heme-binding membrane subunit